MPIHKGVFVDIFPYDKVPENDRERKKLARELSVLNQLFLAKVLWKATSFHGENKKALLTAVRSTLHVACLPVSREYLFNKLDQLVRKYNDTSSSLVTYRAYDFAVARIDDYVPARKCKFGRLEIDIPVHAEKILRRQYGRYMELPPEEKRTGHAPFELQL